MTDTPNPGETVETKNDATQSPAPSATPSIDAAELERLRKEAEQAKMRANQLENQLKKKQEEEEAARLKQLEEQNEWKTVAEQERLKREELERERETEQRSRELKSATQGIFKDYPQEVIEIAETTGLSLSDTDEAAQSQLREKLDAIKAKVAVSDTPRPSNPATNTPAQDQVQLLERLKHGDRQARQDAIANLEAVKAMKQMAGYQE